MLNRFFDPLLIYLVVVYLRMSTDKQNPRSPDQQLAEIKRRLTSLGLPWKIVRVYRDEAKTGRLLRTRTGYQQMMQDIKTGELRVDLILVDSVERLGCVDELPTIRKTLYEKHGILVLTADSNFADPNTPQGKALGMIETMRATEDSRIKGHNVLRGKRDAVQQGHWPGGPPPFGYKLESVMKVDKGRQEVDHCKLVRDPETDWIIKLLFNEAVDSGIGQVKLARFLNDHPDIPEKFKHFTDSSVGYMLENRIYSGELVYARNCTGIVDDMRVLERNREENIIRIQNFCEPIVSREVQDSILRLRKARCENIMRLRQQKKDGQEKLIEPPAPGMTLKYLLSGLVRCGHCGRAMTPSTAGTYETKSGESHSYPAYFCPASVSEICPNKRRVPENWLRMVTIETIRERLFPKDEAGLVTPEWFAPLVEQVRHEIELLTCRQHEQRPTWERELQDIQKKVTGWSLSLANPNLDFELRQAIELEWKNALNRKQSIEDLLKQNDQQDRRLAAILDPAQVRERLDHLDAVLARNNPTLGNMELSLHIDRIDCYDDGRVEMRTCKLGAISGAADLLASDAPRPTISGACLDNKTHMGTPRRRARLRVDSTGDRGSDLTATINMAADPHRFAKLEDQWFWTDVFQIPRRKSWAEEHAVEVAKARMAGLTIGKLVEKFAKTIPTIRAALRHAASVDESLRQQLPKKLPRSHWHEEHASEVAVKKAEGLSTDALAIYFDKSDTTIREALRFACSTTEDDIGAPIDVAAPDGDNAIRDA